MKTVARSCYYAHSLHLYDTPQEIRDVELIEALGFYPVNPNAPEHQKAYPQEGMEYFYELANKCDALAFRAYPNGMIPAGVHGETIRFIENKMANNDVPVLVLELPWGLTRRRLSVPDTRQWLEELGQR